MTSIGHLKYCDSPKCRGNCMSKTDRYILDNTVNHYTGSIGEDFGLGQIDIPTIHNMISCFEKYGLKFKFAKVVTGVDEGIWKERTIKADNNYLFVLGSPHQDLTEFWKDVKKTNTTGSIQIQDDIKLYCMQGD